MKFYTITTPKLDSKFVFCYLQREKVPEAELKLYEKSKTRFIGNQKLLETIKREYTEFKSLNVNMEQYFNCQIIIGVKSRGDHVNFDVKEISKTPLFLARDRNRKFLYGYDLKDFHAKRPIKMNANLIFELYGMEGTLDLNDVPDNVNLYEIIKNVPVITDNTPGESNDENPILIGYDESFTYWVTHRDMVKTLFACDKYPGLCNYSTTDQANHIRHMQTCTDQTCSIRPVL